MTTIDYQAYGQGVTEMTKALEVATAAAEAAASALRTSTFRNVLGISVPAPSPETRNQHDVLSAIRDELRHLSVKAGTLQ